jgi:hypothetical protein
VADVSDNARERFIAHWAETHGGPTPDERLIIEFIADEMEAAERRICGDSKTWRPLGFLGAATIETEDQRVARELVPLVRAAAAEVPLPPRVDVLGGHLRTSRTADDAQHQHVSDIRWAHYKEQHRKDEASAFERYVDRVLGSTLVVQPPQPHPDMDLYTTVLAAMDKMLAPTRPPRRTEPIKLTRGQIDQLPKVDTDERPFTPTSFWLDGIPVVEVLNVEESTPHAEGWCLTISQIITGVYSAFDGAQPDYHKPLHMTRQQIERVMKLLDLDHPDDWEQTLERGGEVSQLLGRPVHLAYNAASSTPCIERWMDR